MRAPISVVIPTLNAATALPGTAAALMEGVEAGLIREVIVVDGGSTDHTAEVAEELGARFLSVPASRGGQLRAGAAAARGDHLLVLHADTQLAPGWSEAATAHLSRATPGAGYFRLAFDSGGLPARLVAGWANLRSRLFGLPYGDQGLLLPATLYAEVGGYPDQPLMEDVAIARALKGRLVALDGVAVTSAAKYRAQGWMRRGGRNLWTLARYMGGVSPERLARDYTSN
ncbi:TIGR04283 family arsenosugar biosynthesis glycosyltransferase [Pseudaestuariivita atlantica]|uniref:Glycosyl transferase n=1 Tax=Pseudaestuariivita atlantica TaxID=1317121 RepID=A0A0L1JLV6_9RHOB|nr:TIGR04283 family arsenosugar biosynthesis glycosyltransferase [Pseudaestuariivita atlantica]KNG92735.1 glycosyl transferase [Pseudaestuariivita atlantica]